MAETARIRRGGPRSAVDSEVRGPQLHRRGGRFLPYNRGYSRASSRGYGGNREAWRKRRAGGANVSGSGLEELKPRLLGLDNCGPPRLGDFELGVWMACEGELHRDLSSGGFRGPPGVGSQIEAHSVELLIGIRIVGCPWRTDPIPAVGSRRCYEIHDFTRRCWEQQAGVA